MDVPLDGWLAQLTARVASPPHAEQHIGTMARLHRENLYGRATDDVSLVTGEPAQTIEDFVAARKDFYLG